MKNSEIRELINKRIEELSVKSKHYVVDMGDMETFGVKEEKVYHKAGNGRRWCSACERIKELKKLLKELNMINMIHNIQEKDGSKSL